MSKDVWIRTTYRKVCDAFCALRRRGEKNIKDVDLTGDTERTALPQHLDSSTLPIFKLCASCPFFTTQGRHEWRGCIKWNPLRISDSMPCMWCQGLSKRLLCHTKVITARYNTYTIAMNWCADLRGVSEIFKDWCSQHISNNALTPLYAVSLHKLRSVRAQFFVLARIQMQFKSFKRFYVLSLTVIVFIHTLNSKPLLH